MLCLGFVGTQESVLQEEIPEFDALRFGAAEQITKTPKS